jgi:hypothetical protein
MAMSMLAYWLHCLFPGAITIRETIIPGGRLNSVGKRGVSSDER